MKTKGLICAAVTGVNAARMAERLEPVLDAVDVVEIRLDSMTEAQVGECCARIAKPLLFTNRPAWEGGSFTGTEEERILPLLEAVRLRAAYVDFELEADVQLRQHLVESIEPSSTRLVISNHNFNCTPAWEDLVKILEQMRASGAHIGKIVTMAQGPEDVLRVLALQGRATSLQFPLIAFCMGEAGRISRMATLYLGGYMSYVSVNALEATAPGQFSARHLHDLCTLFEKQHGC